jgi:hypothetical protein
VFTINGFPYGKFHGTRVKEQVYAPDWTTRERLDYTKLLFDLLAQLLHEGMEGSVSTVPVGFKPACRPIAGRKAGEPAGENSGLPACRPAGLPAVRAARENLWRCVEHLEQLTRRTGRKLHLGLEPEPLCYLETTGETVTFFEQLRADRPGDLRLDEHLGVTYDCCHQAVEYEPPGEALARLRRAGIQISKIHLSNALRVHPTPQVRDALKAFADDTYLHQTIERRPDGQLIPYADLNQALASPPAGDPQMPVEWRIHFHLPLHAPSSVVAAGARPLPALGGPPLRRVDQSQVRGEKAEVHLSPLSSHLSPLPSHVAPHFGTTADHLLGVLDAVRQTPGLCRHFEMETYTWEVLPPELKNRNVVDQLASEYQWTLARFAERDIQVVT